MSFKSYRDNFWHCIKFIYENEFGTTARCCQLTSLSISPAAIPINSHHCRHQLSQSPSTHIIVDISCQNPRQLTLSTSPAAIPNSHHCRHQPSQSPSTHIIVNITRHNPRRLSDSSQVSQIIISFIGTLQQGFYFIQYVAAGYALVKKILTC